MAKTFKNLLLQNPKSFDLETWHAALGSQISINEDPGLTLTYFMESFLFSRCTKLIFQLIILGSIMGFWLNPLSQDLRTYVNLSM